MDDDQSIGYTQHILMVTSLKIYKQVLSGFKELDKGLSGDHWALERDKRCSHGTVLDLLEDSG